MPRKMKTAAADQAALPQISAELLEKLIPGPVTAGQLEDIIQQFKKAFIQQALGAEMSHHLGYAPGQAKPAGATNHRNGSRIVRLGKFGNDQMKDLTRGCSQRFPGYLN